MTPEKLTTLFESFGKIEKVDLKTKEGGKCKGFGFIAYATADEASKAMAEMNDKEVDGKKLAVTLAFDSTEKGNTEKGKGKGSAGNNSQAAQYQAYQAQMQNWYALQMQT